MDEIHHEINEFLAEMRTLSLATVDDAGRPHAANLWYASDPQQRLYFVSNPDSAHCRHIAVRPDVALTIYAPRDTPDQIHGLQMHGQCTAVAPERAAEVMQLFVDKFPSVAASKVIRNRMLSERFYAVRLTWLRWIDNRRGFGWKFEPTKL